MYQSKYAVISYVLINILFYFNIKSKINIGKIIILLFISQSLLFFFVSNSRIVVNKIDTNFFSFDEKENIYKNENRIKHFRKFGNPKLKGIDYAEHAIFSGRVVLWKKSLEYIKLRPFMGYGSMSDRHIINKKRLTKNALVNPISNAFMYALLSGGVFSLMLFIYFWLSIRERLFYIFTFQNTLNKEKIIGTTIICLIGLRCLIENSVMLFGVDYLLLLNSLYLTENK
tara:strand:- start:361 stop:1044 length:684 start_codon:yes stop_codon:yes gene_type:complete